MGVGSFLVGFNFIDWMWNEDRKEKRYEEVSLIKFINYLINFFVWYWLILLDGFLCYEGFLYIFICIILRMKRVSYVYYLFFSIVDVEDNY